MTNTGKFSLLKPMATLIFVGALFGCASSPSPAPTELLTQVEFSIQAAEQAEASREAPVALRSAKDHLTQAKQSIRDEEYEAATRQLERAMADADYATTKSRSEKMQQAAEQVDRTIDTLQEELKKDQSS